MFMVSTGQDDQVTKFLILTVGLPYSGKSTWAREEGYPIVSPDAIRLAIHGQRYIETAEPLVWVYARTMVRSLFLAGNNFVILDACNNTIKRREEWKSSNKEWITYCKYFDTSVEKCLERAIKAKDDYIIPVIHRMAAEHEPLGDLENKWGQ